MPCEEDGYEPKGVASMSDMREKDERTDMRGNSSDSFPVVLSKV